MAPLLLGAGACIAPSDDPSGAPDDVVGRIARADSLVADWVAHERIPGAVLLVSRDRVVVHEGAHGWARLFEYGSGQYSAEGPGPSRLEHPEPMSADAVFDLASVTKVVGTTMGVMLLVDRGAIELDAPVSRYVTDFTGDGRDEVTVRHLLTHRSGLPQWVPVYQHAADPATAHEYVRSLPLAWPPGDERHYSDLGFMLLGRLVQQVSGLPLDAFLQSELYGPLGLRNTGFRPTSRPAPRRRSGPMGGLGASPGTFAATSHGNPYERRMVEDPDFGYRIEGDPGGWSGWRAYTLSGEVNDGNAHHAFGGVAGHAGLFSTAVELQRLLDVMLSRGTVEGRRIVSAATVDRFLASTGDGQALGWQLPEYAPDGSFGHTGFTGTFVLGVPSQRMAVILLTNRQNLGVDGETRYPDVGPLQRAVTAALTNPEEPS